MAEGLAARAATVLGETMMLAPPTESGASDLAASVGWFAGASVLQWKLP